ncbi:MAG: HAD-IIIA family hydrolase [Candidatus Methanoperedens sp.]|nr:HAD-IIIA family hydrolase [Candidatus Methanoperedens sp.]MCZ7371198.1 HAD-IIIA family hydrolase [Candidatus Methanoperedens sp.]
MTNINNRAVFLDRDGVINEIVFHDGEKPSSPWRFEEFKLVAGIEKPLGELSSMGYYLFIISNQPDISRGYIEEGTTEKINEMLYELFPIQDIMVCPHDDRDKCTCRKPKPGMLMDLSKKWKVDLIRSFLIGDNWKDIDAGKAAGCITLLIDKPYNQSVKVDYRVESLEDAVVLIRKIGGDL